MKTESTITPTLLSAFLSGAAAPEEIEHLRKRAQQDAGFGLLLELLTEARNDPRIDPGAPYTGKDTPDFESLSTALGDWLAGTAAREQRQEFISALLHSQAVFQKTMLILQDLSPTLAAEPLPESVADLRGVKSNRQLLAETVLKPGPGESVVEKLRQFGEALWKPLGNLLPSVRFAGGLSAALALLVVLAVLFLPGNQDPFAVYRWNEALPYSNPADLSLAGSEVSSGFRGGEAENRIIRIANTLGAVYSEAMKQYQKRDYQTALRYWQRGEDMVQELETQLTQSTEAFPGIPRTDLDRYKRLVQNYYFYQGLTGLAFLREKNIRNIPEAQFKSTLSQLIRAKALANRFALDTDDREVFFIALAHGFRGETLQCRAYLAQVGPGSAYFQEAATLLQKIGKD